MDRPWLHDMHGHLRYRWLQKNVRMRNDDTGIEITYRERRPDDSICGARSIKPGDTDGPPGPWWFPVDPREDYEVGCTVVRAPIGGIV